MYTSLNIGVVISCAFFGAVFAQSNRLMFTTSDSYDVCSEKFGKNVKCSVITQCPTFKEIKFSDSERTVIVKLISNLNCGYSDRLPKICCLNAKDLNRRYENELINARKIITDTYTRTTTTKRLSTTSRPVEVTQSSNKYSCDSIHDVDGISFSTKISGGIKTNQKEFPWIARIATRDVYEEKNKFTCIGSLLSDRYVLTAAHCVYNIIVKGVRLGEHDAETEWDCFDNQCVRPSDVAIQDIIVHENYTGSSINGEDIALIKLTRPVKFSAVIHPICLPKAANILDYDPSNNQKVNYSAAGWGKTETGAYSAIKRKVTLPSAEISTCLNVYALSNDLSDSIICAGGEKGKDVCYGDSGTSLAGLHNDRWYIFGIASAGHLRCGTEGVPGLYTRVTKYLDWIARHTS